MHLRARQGRRRHDRDGRQRATPTTRSGTTSSPTPPARPTASRRWSRCCTTRFGIERGFLTTVHAYTNDQDLLDAPHKDLRRARRPPSTSSRPAPAPRRPSAWCCPELAGRLDGVAAAGAGRRRVAGRPTVPAGPSPSPPRRSTPPSAPRPAGSSTGILRYSERPVVSPDVIGDPASCVLRLRAHPAPPVAWSRSSAGTTTSGATPSAPLDLVEMVARLLPTR